MRLYLETILNNPVLTAQHADRFLQCQNCDFIGTADVFHEVENATQRFTPGDAYTDAQCPHCGCLAYPAPQSSIQAVLNEIITDEYKHTLVNQTLLHRAVPLMSVHEQLMTINAHYALQGKPTEG